MHVRKYFVGYLLFFVLGNINDRKLWVNGYFLDFSNRIKL
jgi:hypothetical protein